MRFDDVLKPLIEFAPLIAAPLSSSRVPTTDRHYLFVVESISIPKREWGVLIGGLVHKMRSALNHTMYAAATSPGYRNHFPIFAKKAIGIARSSHA